MTAVLLIGFPFVNVNNGADIMSVFYMAINTHKRLQKIRCYHLHFGSFPSSDYGRWLAQSALGSKKNVLAFMLASSWCFRAIFSNDVEVHSGISHSISCTRASHRIHRISIFDSFWHRIPSTRNDERTKLCSMRWILQETCSVKIDSLFWVIWSICTYRHRRWLDCKRSINCRIIDDNAFHNKPVHVFRNGDDPRMVSRTWHTRSAQHANAYQAQ